MGRSNFPYGFCTCFHPKFAGTTWSMLWYRYIINRSWRHMNKWHTHTYHRTSGFEISCLSVIHKTHYKIYIVWDKLSHGCPKCTYHEHTEHPLVTTTMCVHFLNGGIYYYFVVMYLLYFYIPYWIEKHSVSVSLSRKSTETINFHTDPGFGGFNWTPHCCE